MVPVVEELHPKKLFIWYKGKIKAIVLRHFVRAEGKVLTIFREVWRKRDTKANRKGSVVTTRHIDRNDGEMQR